MNSQSYKDVSCIELALALGLKQNQNGNFHCFRPYLHKNNDRHASLSITHKGFHCFACGVEGNNVELVKSVLNLDTAEAIRKIEEIANIRSWQTNEKSNKSNHHRSTVSLDEGKRHCRMISDDINERYIFISENKLKPRPATQKDLKEIEIKLRKKWSLETLNKLNILINDNPYCLVFPFCTENVVIDTEDKVKFTNIVVEGRTDLITAVEIGVLDEFTTISRFNKSSKIELTRDDIYFFILDRDDNWENIIKHTLNTNEALIKLVRLPNEYKDLSDYYYESGLEKEAFYKQLRSLFLEAELYSFSQKESKEEENFNSEITNNCKNHTIMNSNYHFKTISIKELVENQLPEKKYLVDKLIPDEGYCILGGRSKGGKSWLLLLLCLSVSQGGVFLGKKCSKVGSLYIALEDSQRRIKERINQLLDFEPPEKRIVPDGLDFIFDFPKLNKGGYEFLDNYLSVNKEKKLIVIDTIRKITSRGRQANDYDSEYSDGGLLQKLALKHNCLIISAAHTRKTPSENSVFDEIAGSVGFIAAADILLVLKRGKSMSKLHITGRDIEDIELLLNFHNGLWSSLGKEEDVKCSTINIEWEKIIIPEITRKELVGLLMSSYQIGQSLAYRVISEAITNGEIFLNGKYIQTN